MADSNSDRDIFEEAREAVEQARRRADDAAHDETSGADGADGQPSKLPDDLPDLDSLREIYERNPYAVLGAAAGVGYTLGGGLLSPFTKRLMRMGMKALVLPIALSRLRELTHEAGGELSEDGSGSPPGRLFDRD